MDRFRFADFLLDRRKRQLLRGSEVVRIGARAFDLLETLLVQRDRVVPRDEIVQAV
jgi:DNA-binding winged helix-turn-helix (wHTH) protein